MIRTDPRRHAAMFRKRSGLHISHAFVRTIVHHKPEVQTQPMATNSAADVSLTREGRWEAGRRLHLVIRLAVES